MIETWMTIRESVGKYEVSNLGRVRSLKTLTCKIMKPSVSAGGYEVISLWLTSGKKMFYVHRLVAELFCVKEISTSRRLVVDHIDEVKTNNNSSNLRWVTDRFNSDKAIKRRDTKSKFIGVTWRERSKKWDARITINGIRKHLGSFLSEEDASNEYQLNLKNIL